MASPLTKQPRRVNDNTEQENLTMKYKTITSTLPRIDSPYTAVALHKYKGFWLPLVYLEATLSMHQHFKAQPSDIYLCGLPKTGSTWLKILVFSIMSRERLNDPLHPVLNQNPHDLVPTLENHYVTNPSILNTLELPIITTHLPYTLLPPSILESKCKILYLVRDPKEVFIATWHFQQTMKYVSNNEEDGRQTNCVTDLGPEFDKFSGGMSAYGPYWDHVLEYWKASNDKPDTVFFFKYDDLMRDTVGYVKKLAEFLGKPLSKEEESQGVAERVVEMSHLKNLGGLEVNKSGSAKACSALRMDNNAFFQKEEDGDWKGLLTEDMVKSVDHLTQDKFQSLGESFFFSASKGH